MSDKLTGRALDAQVAERCFGWQWWLYIEDNGLVDEACLLSPDWVNGLAKNFSQWRKVGSDYPNIRDFDSWPEPLPCYSEDMAAAWQVAEWILEQTGVFELEYVQIMEIWILTYDRPREGHYGTFVEADTPSEAICHAALKLMEQLEDA